MRRQAAFPGEGREVPVFVERSGQFLHGVEPDAKVSQRTQDGARLFQLRLQPPLPDVIEEERRLHLVHDAERGVDAGLYRVLAQQRRAEGMDGADRCPVERTQRVDQQPFARLVVALAALLLQRVADASLQLRGRHLGKGDGDYPLHRHPGEDGGDEPVGQQPGLAGARAGFHRVAMREVLGRPAAVRLIYRQPRPVQPL